MHRDNDGADVRQHGDPKATATTTHGKGMRMTNDKDTTHDHDELACEFRRFRDIYRTNHDTVFVHLINHLRKRASSNLHVGDAEAAAYLRGHDLVGVGGDSFKCNNNALPVYMREICRECPDLAGRIELRASRFDRFYTEGGGACGD